MVNWEKIDELVNCTYATYLYVILIGISSSLFLHSNNSFFLVPMLIGLLELFLRFLIKSNEMKVVEMEVKRNEWRNR